MDCGYGYRWRDRGTVHEHHQAAHLDGKCYGPCNLSNYVERSLSHNTVLVIDSRRLPFT